jgi:hypothetical protein
MHKQSLIIHVHALMCAVYVMCRHTMRNIRFQNTSLVNGHDGCIVEHAALVYSQGHAVIDQLKIIVAQLRSAANTSRYKMHTRRLVLWNHHSRLTVVRQAHGLQALQVQPILPNACQQHLQRASIADDKPQGPALRLTYITNCSSTCT